MSQQNGVSATGYTVIVSEETDDTPTIRSASVNGEDYKFDYAGLANRPVFEDRSEGPIMLESVTLAFSTQAEGK